MGPICREISASLAFPMDAISFLNLPQPVSLVVRAVHLCNFFGRSIARLEIRQQHPGLYLAGVFANARYGDAEFLRVAAQIVCIAKTFLSVAEDGAQIIHGCSRIDDSLLLTKRIVLPYAENRLTSDRWSAQEGRTLPLLFLPWPVAHILSHAILLPKRVIGVIQDIWNLNMHLFDMYDAIQMNPHSRSAAIDDLFIDVGDMVGQVIGRERRLSKAVGEYRPWVDAVLRLMGVDSSAQKIIGILDRFADQAQEIKERGEAPAHAAMEVMKGASAVISSFVVST